MTFSSICFEQGCWFKIVRLVANHPHFGVTLMTADRKAGQSMDSVFPHLTAQKLPRLISIKDADFSTVDAVFCCLPHGTTQVPILLSLLIPLHFHIRFSGSSMDVFFSQEIIKRLPTSLKIVDLSADFRLRDISEYEEWYGQPHKAVELQKEVVYGLTELLRDDIKKALLVANPGCYPTSVQLPLVPLLKDTGAKEANLYSEIAEGISSYGVTRHRHVPEIEQGLSDVAQSKVTVSFTPHLMPMIRGMQSTIYVEMAPGVRTQDLYQQKTPSILLYEEEFVKVVDEGVVPQAHNIDNLVKGASGQALQNLNIMFGLPETTGLLHQPLFP
ncbi:hypothetical protein Bca101_032552 [Brassica carinata]